MALINNEKKEINAKIVYYGPALSGKTTNVKFLYEKMKPEYRGKLKFLNTHSGKMFFFDFMRPDQIGVRDYAVRFHIYTVPGEVVDYSIWKTVLKGMDGLVFVADSDPMQMQSNLLSLEKLTDYWKTLGEDADDIPCLIQCNKQDIPGAATSEEVADLLHSLKCPVIPASAEKGEGVLNTLSTIVKMSLQKLRETSIEIEAEPPVFETGQPDATVQGVDEFEPREQSAPLPEEVKEAEFQGEFKEEEVKEDEEEEVVCEQPPEFISFTGFTSPETPSFAGDEAWGISAESAAPPVFDLTADLLGDMEQVAPGHLRLPIVIKCGDAMKRMSINLRLSLEPSDG